jgi:hypothetical protein
MREEGDMFEQLLAAGSTPAASRQYTHRRRLSRKRNMEPESTGDAVTGYSDSFGV